MTRDRDGGIHLLLNRCAHRGNQVCNDAKGNSATFRCPLHGWTYRNTGELIGFPFFKGYGGRKLDLAMGRVPRVDSYEGFVFGSFAEEGPRWWSISVSRGWRDRPAGAAVAARAGGADGGVAAAPRQCELEAVGGERDRRLSPSVRARLDLRGDGSTIGPLYSDASTAVTRDPGQRPQ